MLKMANPPPNFERSISLNDLDSSLRVRECIKEDIVSPADESKHCHLRNWSEFTFVLRSFKDLALDFKKFLYSYLLDVGIYKELEQSKKLNWCPSLYPMVPVLTLGDGNCLMHAASIGMWAVNDRYHTLRKLVYDAILEDTEGLFHKRWQREEELTNLRIHGYSMTEEQWDNEWETVLQLVSQEEFPQGNHGMQYGSLEEIHIFVLANVLRRTIIVVSSDTLRGNYDESLSPVNFPGIYMPLNWDPVECVKTPLVIGFAQGHFTAIVSFEDGVFDQGEVLDGVGKISERIHGVPLQKHDGTPLPIHFLFANEEELTDGLLRQYLDCKKLTYKNPEDGTLAVTLAAKMNFVLPPEPIKTLVEGFFARASETYFHMVQTKELQAAGGETPHLVLRSCRTEGCEFFGTSETLFMCSKCLEKHLKDEGNQAAFLLHNMAFSGAEAALKEEHALCRNTGANIGTKKEASPSASGVGATVGELIPQVSFVQQQQTMKQEQTQQQTVGFVHQQQQREFELIQQQRQQQQQQQQRQQEEFELLREEQRQQQQQQQQKQQELELLREQQLQQQQQQELELLREQQRQQQQQQEMELLREQQRQQQQQQQQQQELEQRQKRQQREFQLEEQQKQQQQQDRRVREEQQQKKCLTQGCKYEANAETGNLCFRCYEAEMLAEQQTASMVSMNIQAKPCANHVNGCQYYGIPQQDDFCSRCYRKFHLEMESTVGLRNVEFPSRSEAVTQPPPTDACQTAGCPNTGCPDLYGRCVDCYSQCIKNFITTYDGLPLGGAAQTPLSPQPFPSPQPSGSQSSSSPRPLTSPQASPLAPLPQSSPLPQASSPSQLGQSAAKQGALCVTPGCQNKGVPSYGGKCIECYKIKPLNIQHTVSTATKTREMNVSTNTTAHASTVAAGLPCGEPALKEESNRLFCKTPKCNNPVREYNLCTHCIMDRYQQESPNLPYPPPSSGESGSRTTVEAGLGAVGFGVENVGQNRLQGGDTAEERRKAARQNLPPLQMPPSSAKTGLNTTQTGNLPSVTTPGLNIKCVAPNCTFFGNAEHNYYCSRCFEKNREEWKKISEMARARRSRHNDPLVQEPLARDVRVVTHRPNKLGKCALTYCYNLETPGNNGLCDRCYRTGITTEREWQLTNRALLESQRQQIIFIKGSTAPAPKPPPAAATAQAKPLKKGFIDTGAPCKTQGCLKFGTPAQQGFCDPCYEKLQKNQASSASTSASGFSSSPVLVCVAQQRTSQPTNWSNVRNGPLLQSSGVTTTFSAQDPIPVTQQNTSHFGARVSNRCKEEGCRLTGAPEYGGYCSQCFVEYTRQSSYPESVPDLKDSPKVPTTSTISSLNNSNLVTGGLTTTEPGAPRVCAMEGCENFVSPRTMLHCRECFAKYYPNLLKNQEAVEKRPNNV